MACLKSANFDNGQSIELCQIRRRKRNVKRRNVQHGREVNVFVMVNRIFLKRFSLSITNQKLQRNK